MNHGLPEKSYQMIVDGISQFNSIIEAYIYGSRAIGNHKKGSDVDIAIKGKEITYDTVHRLSSILNEDLPLPYFFDIIHYNTIQNQELKKQIDEFGVRIYSRAK